MWVLCGGLSWFGCSDDGGGVPDLGDTAQDDVQDDPRIENDMPDQGDQADRRVDPPDRGGDPGVDLADVPDQRVECGLSATVQTSTGIPLADARVELIGLERASFETDAVGQFDAPVACGSYEAWLTSYLGVDQALPDVGNWPLSDDVVVDGPVEITLTLDTATVSGVVLDSEGEALDGTGRVEAVFAHGGQTVFNRVVVSETDGSYAMTLVVSATAYTLTAAAVGGEATYLEAPVDQVVDDDKTVDFALVEVTPCTWSGTIRTSEGAVLGSAEFSIDDLTMADLTFTGDGSFEAVVPCDSYHVTVDHPRRGDPLRPYFLRLGLVDAVDLGEDNDAGLVVPVVTVSGSVTADGAPVEGARVVFGNAPGGGTKVEGNGVSDSSGDYSLLLPPMDDPYTRTVPVSHGSGLLAPAAATLTIDADLTHDVTLETVDVCQVSGTVEADTGPIPEAKVQLSGTTDAAFLTGDVEGEFSGVVNCGTFDVVIFADATPTTPGFDGWLWLQDEVIDDDVSLESGFVTATLSGTVKDDLANGVEDARVSARLETAQGDVLGVARSGGDGSYSLTVLPNAAVDYAIDVVPEAGPYGALRGTLVRVEADATQDLVVPRLPTQSFSGHFETSQGEALADAQLVFEGVRAADGEAHEFVIDTDGSGDFEEAVLPGVYQVEAARVRGPAALGAYPLSSEIPNVTSWPLERDLDIEGLATHDFTLPVVRVRGHAETVREEPLEGVEIELVVGEAGSVHGWNRVRTDDQGDYSVIVVLDADTDYTITAQPPEETALEVIEEVLRLAADTTLDFTW